MLKSPPFKSIIGFTLVELSIVIVIIGLLIGGVTAGVSLVKSAGLQSVITNVNKYKLAINTFKLQYDALPGDLRNAQTYWPSGNTNNGNGDRRVAWAWGSAPNENLLVWQHLALAGVIEGSYRGTTGGTTSIIGINIPRAGYKDAGLEFFTFNHTIIYGRNEQAIHFGNNSSSNSPIADDQIVSPNDAKNIDTKIDDGIAYTGKVFGGNGDTVTGCVSNSWTAPSNYNTSDVVLCRMFFYGIANK